MINGTQLHIVRVFVNSKNQFGNPVGIVIDEKRELDNVKRQSMAKQIGFSETVFINNSKTGDISIFNPQEECAFAMHATLGTVWFIRHILKKSIDHVQSKDERIDTWGEKDITWLKAKLSVLPEWNLEEFKTTSVVENMSKEDGLSKKHTLVWSWLDKDKKIIRARTFAPDWGIPEDEANGSGAMRLAAELNSNLEIIHGKGSLIYVKSYDQNYAEVGGRCYK